jgi:small ligand-binding sensory domain FIST
MLTSKTEGEAPSLEGWPVGLESTARPHTFFLFADPFSTPIDELLSLLDQHAPGSSAIGGIASGGMEVGESRMVLNRDIIGSGVVGVAVQGGVEIRTVVSQGCQPIGERYVVTKVDRNVIQELGGIPPLERLETTLKALGERERQQVAGGLQVGIAMDEHRSEFGQGDFLIRGLLGADRQSGSLAIADFIQEGQTIQFHVRDAHAASEDFHLLLSKERVTHPDSLPKGALLFSCNGRGQRFFETPHHDVATVQERMGAIPIAGFFAGGEIGPVGGKNYLHGYTASMALFYDEASRPS